ncbi:MAG: TrbI/VirB10 family protein [Actinomycetota bacterium]|nr:TrbI/VirB10 family protein [Actinomycetota bacterium]
MLFAVLDGQRRALTVPTTEVRMVDRVELPAALPPLYLPPEPPPPPPPPQPEALVAAVATAPVRPPFPMGPVQAQPALPNYPAPAFAAPTPQPLPVLSGGSGPALVIDTTVSRAEGGTNAAATGVPGAVRTTRLSRRAMTVPQGTLIPAVLETALDSTRPGHVRAIVSRDITGFDGSQILIPRGSRLFGDYQSDMAAGQNRALVQWTRLVRPDGVSVAIASPAADMQGRAGIQGRVDNHFLERFGGALLQTTLNVGSAFATRSIAGDAPVIVASTGAIAVPDVTPSGSRGQPTLHVDAGTRVGVFVARDLEFPSGEVRQ